MDRSVIFGFVREHLSKLFGGPSLDIDVRIAKSDRDSYDEVVSAIGEFFGTKIEFMDLVATVDNTDIDCIGLFNENSCPVLIEDEQISRATGRSVAFPVFFVDLDSLSTPSSNPRDDLKRIAIEDLTRRRFSIWAKKGDFSCEEDKLIISEHKDDPIGFRWMDPIPIGSTYSETKIRLDISLGSHEG